MFFGIPWFKSNQYHLQMILFLKIGKFGNDPVPCYLFEGLCQFSQTFGANLRDIVNLPEVEKNANTANQEFSETVTNPKYFILHLDPIIIRILLQRNLSKTISLNMYRIIALAYFSAFAFYPFSLAQSQPVYTLAEKQAPTVNISPYTSAWVDNTGKLTIEDIIAADTLPFAGKEEFDPVISFPAVVWLKVEIANDNEQGRNALLNFCSLADSILLYDVADSKVINTSATGSAFAPRDKEILSVNHNLLIALPAKTTKTFYARIYFAEPVRRGRLVELYLKDTQPTLYELYFRYAGQAFYAGLMLMFGLLSFFAYLLFRDRSFAYFGLVHLAFTFYFLVVNSAFEILVFNAKAVFGFGLTDLSITLLIAALFNFFAHYLRLKKNKPSYFSFYLGATWIVALNKYFHFHLLNNYDLSAIINNIFILVWIVITVIPVVQLARLRDKSGINLLISLTLLIVSSMIYLLALIDILPLNFFTKYSIQLGSIIFSLLVFYRLFEIVQTISSEKQKAQTLNEMKSKFFANVSHEFRTPLTLIIDPLRKLIEKSKEPEDRKLMRVSLKNANRLLRMVNQLLDLSRVESRHMELTLEKKDIVPFLKGLVMSFESLAEIRHTEIVFESPQKPLHLWVDTEKMEVIFSNLLSNAFKFTPSGGKVAVTILEHEHTVEVLVSDTGVGIAADKLPFVFDRFFKIENPTDHIVDRSGIGLSLSKELVELHHGTIKVESETTEGTTFSVTFKKGNAHFPKDQFSTNADSANQPGLNSAIDLETLKEQLNDPDIELEGSTISLHGAKPTILLVEDNLDVRKYLRDQLTSQFNVLEATNGSEGFDLAVKHMPELVISDVMMPVMNGFELCKLLKQDVKTSHIPVILLTAKAENEHKIAGLELGADDYLTKPFFSKELNIRIRKLIELRVQLRKKLLESPTLSIKSANGNPIENRFLELVGDYMDKHLADPQTSADALAEYVGLSRVQLNRKLKSITSMTTNKYIQHLRLHKALILLETENLNVSEVAFKTGFASVAYFVKCFREQFGKTPGSIQMKD